LPEIENRPAAATKIGKRVQRWAIDKLHRIDNRPTAAFLVKANALA